MTARSTAETRKLDPTAITVFRQGDIGEYLREVGNSCFMDPWQPGRWLTPYRKIVSLRLEEKEEKFCIRGIVYRCSNTRYLVVNAGVLGVVFLLQPKVSISLNQDRARWCSDTGLMLFGTYLSIISHSCFPFVKPGGPIGGSGTNNTHPRNIAVPIDPINPCKVL